MAGDTGTVGITDHAQKELGEIVYVELPKVGDKFNAGESFGSVESVKAVSELFMPVSGEVIEVNEELGIRPEKINEDPYGTGWMIRIRLADQDETADLMSAEEYDEYTKSEEVDSAIRCDTFRVRPPTGRKCLPPSALIRSNNSFPAFPKSFGCGGFWTFRGADRTRTGRILPAASSAKNSRRRRRILGAGVYRHHIPIIIDALISRSEFYTAYTPYQAEIAQGTLQAIFEFQTYIAQLTGMEVANASLYDGSTGLAEAVLMAHRITKKNRFLIAKTVHPEYRAVVNTYAKNLGIEIELIDYATDGRVDLGKLEQQLGRQESPRSSFSRPISSEPLNTRTTSAELAHKHGALSIVNVCEAISLGILKPPGQDSPRNGLRISSSAKPVARRSVSFGGPHVGFLATRERYVRQMPGRLVGMGKDHSGRPGVRADAVDARATHPPRESDIEHLHQSVAVRADGDRSIWRRSDPQGLREICEQNILKTDYAVCKSRHAYEAPYSVPGAPRFNEFVVEVDRERPRNVRDFRCRVLSGTRKRGPGLRHRNDAA